MAYACTQPITLHRNTNAPAIMIDEKAAEFILGADEAHASSEET